MSEVPLYCAHASVFMSCSDTVSVDVPTLYAGEKTGRGHNLLFLSTEGRGVRLSTRWSSRVSLTPASEVLRDQICTTSGPKINCAMQVDF
jgi:hypothetical protein